VPRRSQVFRSALCHGKLPHATEFQAFAACSLEPERQMNDPFRTISARVWSIALKLAERLGQDESQDTKACSPGNSNPGSSHEITASWNPAPHGLEEDDDDVCDAHFDGRFDCGHVCCNGCFLRRQCSPRKRSRQRYDAPSSALTSRKAPGCPPPHPRCRINRTEPPRRPVLLCANRDAALGPDRIHD
jgi:hypothetical protein